MNSLLCQYSPQDLEFDPQVGYAAPHGSSDRTYAHGVQRNVDQPRYMYPPEKYAQTAAAWNDNHLTC